MNRKRPIHISVNPGIVVKTAGNQGPHFNDHDNISNDHLTDGSAQVMGAGGCGSDEPKCPNNPEPTGSTTYVTVTDDCPTDKPPKPGPMICPKPDKECSKYAAGTPLVDQANFVLHGCGADGKGSIGLDDLIKLIITHDGDSDGLTNFKELLDTNTDPLNPDTDGDGLTDGNEVNFEGTDPTNPDTDSDGLIDGQEVNTTSTNPLNPDTDDDGLRDGVEVNTTSTNPLNPDTDGDGLGDGQEVNTTATDPLDVDSDDDDLSDGEEVNTIGTDPNNPDTDGDGLIDSVEVNTTTTDPMDADSDNDGLSDGDEVNTISTDPLDADSDDDTLSDGVEVNTHGTDPNNPDTDGGGRPDGNEVDIGRDPLDGDDDNLPPESLVTGPTNGTENDPFTLDASGSSDPDGNTLTHLWEVVDASGATVTLSSTNTPTTDIVVTGFDTTVDIIIRHTVTDPSGATGSTDYVTTMSPNAAPTADITGPTDGSGTIELSGAGSSDTDGTVDVYAWSQVSGTPATIVSPSAQVTDIQLPTVTSDEPLVFELCVTDNDGDVNCTQTTVTALAPVNTSPVPNITGVVDGNMQTSGTADGSGSSDADGDTLTYSWSEVTSTGITFATPNAASTSYTLPVVTQDTTATIQLCVDDGTVQVCTTQDITILFVPVVGCPDTDKVLTNNLIVNGDFETVTSTPTGPDQISKASPWETSGTPDLLGPTFQYPPFNYPLSPNGGNFAGAFYNAPIQEIIRQSLTNVVPAGSQIRVDAWVRAGQSGFGVGDGNRIGINTKDSSGNVTAPVANLEVSGLSDTNAVWQHVSVTFTTSTDIAEVQFAPASDTGAPYMTIDSIEFGYIDDWVCP